MHLLDRVYQSEKIRKKRSTCIGSHLEIFDSRSEVISVTVFHALRAHQKEEGSEFEIGI